MLARKNFRLALDTGNDLCRALFRAATVGEGERLLIDSHALARRSILPRVLNDVLHFRLVAVGGLQERNRVHESAESLGVRRHLVWIAWVVAFWRSPLLSLHYLSSSPISSRSSGP
eukprot:1155861-Rhodomonas_salina.1